MKSFLRLLLALSMVVPLIHAQPPRTKKAPASPGLSRSNDVALVELEKQFFAAIREKNMDKLNGLLADDFAYVAPGRPEMTRAQFLKHVQALPDTIEWLGADDLRVRTFGDVAVVTGVRNTKTRAESGTLISSDTAFADIFRKYGEEWELTLVHAVDVSGPASSHIGK